MCIAATHFKSFLSIVLKGKTAIPADATVEQVFETSSHFLYLCSYSHPVTDGIIYDVAVYNRKTKACTKLVTVSPYRRTALIRFAELVGELASME